MDGGSAEVELDALPVGAVVLRGGAVEAANLEAARILVDDDVKALEGRDLAAVVSPLRGESLPEPDGARGWIVRATTEARAMVELRSGPVRTDGTHLVVVLDVTAEARASGIVGALGDSTMVLTPDGIVKWQSGDVDLLADEGHGGVGRNPLELVHPEDLPTVLDTFVRAVGRPGRRFEVSARSHGVGEGNWQAVEITGVYAPRAPGVEGIISQVRNVGRGRFVGSLSSDGEFLSLTDAAPVGLIVGDLFGRTVYTNPEARRLLRFSAEDAKDREWVELIASDDERAVVASSIETAVFEGRTQSHTVHVEFEDGAGAWLRVNVSPRFAEGEQAVGLITTLDDVTSEIEARAEADRLKEMLDASSDYVVVFRPLGELIYANSAYRELLGIGKEPVDGPRHDRGGRLLDLIPEELRDEWLARAGQVVASEDFWRGEFEVQAADGHRLPVSALVVLHRGAGGGLDWVAMLARDISELKAAEQRLREVATTDHLTGLPNRMLFNDRLDQAVARHHRTRQGLAVLFCDLDGYKEINDTFGHAAGDELLVTVAHRIREIVRESDTAARVGGDEFVIVAEGVTDTEQLATLAERIIEVVSQRMVTTAGDQLRVGISVGIGVALPRNADVAPDALLSLADSAMYKAKARGGNRYQIAPLPIG